MQLFNKLLGGPIIAFVCTTSQCVHLATFKNIRLIAAKLKNEAFIFWVSSVVWAPGMKTWTIVWGLHYVRLLVGISLIDPPKLGEYHGLHVLVPIGMPNQCTTGLHPQHSYNTNNLLFFRMFLNEFKSWSGHTVMHVLIYFACN